MDNFLATICFGADVINLVDNVLKVKVHAGRPFLVFGLVFVAFFVQVICNVRASTYM